MNNTTISKKKDITTDRERHIISILAAIFIIFSSATSFAQYDSIIYAGISRTYLLHLPTGYSETDSLPLIIAMHGGLGNAYNIEMQSGLSDKADSEHFIVVYPEGAKGGLLGVRTWNAGWCCGAASDSNIDDAGFINALLDTLINQYSIDKKRIYATGMSNGGFMSYRLACELSDRIAAIAPVAASMSLTNCNPTRAVPIIHFHSYLDQNVPYEGGIGTGISNHYNPPVDSVLNGWANSNGCTIANDTIVHSDEYDLIKWGACNCEVEIDCYVTHDGGHSWPGGNHSLTGDSVSIFINATDLMWSFFQQYSLPCSTTSVNETKDDNDYIIFPNPTSGIIKIALPSTIRDYTLIVYNNFGQIIMTSTNAKTINLSKYPAGIYYLSIRSKEHIFKNKIIIKS